MKRLSLLLLIVLITYISIYCPATAYAADENKVKLIYFYSPTCGSCQNLKDFFIDLKSKYKNLTLIEYSISDLKSKSLLDKYSTAYNIPLEDTGTVPAVFIRDRYFIDEKDIRQSVENIILDKSGPETLEIKEETENHDSDFDRFLNYKILAILTAGLVNGLNPCSMSMLLMFLSLLVFKGPTVLKIGVSYCLGRFLSYMLLGTVFFKFLDSININGFDAIIKALTLVVILMLIILNINDYFAAINEQYNKIKLQLPLIFRRLNHNLMKKVSSISSIKLLILISFAFGIFISFGEFLCTGQIYLTTIVTVFQSGSALGSMALYSLFIYNIGFILPALCLTIAVYKGKEIFEVSEAIRERLHIIKLINSIILLAFGIIMYIYL